MNTFSADEFGEPPTLLVCGVGAFARALTQVLVGSSRAEQVDLAKASHGESFGTSVSRLHRVGTVLLIWHKDQTLADMLWSHGQLWRLILSENGEDICQSIRWVISSPAALSVDQRAQLARGLMVPEVNGKYGYALWARAAGLKGLLEAIETTAPTEAQEWEARKRDDFKRQHLASLKNSLLDGNLDAVRADSQAVLAQFKSLEIEIDFYCVPPGHPNGGQWRSWLKEAVTRDVTHEAVARGQSLLPLLNL